MAGRPDAWPAASGHAADRVRFLRACAPVDPSTNLTTLETPAPPAPPPPADPTPVLKASLDDLQGDEKKLAAELAALEADLRGKVALCKPVEPKPPPPRLPGRYRRPPPAPPAPLPADRWAQKDLGMLQGCWRLGRDTQGSMGYGPRIGSLRHQGGADLLSGQRRRRTPDDRRLSANRHAHCSAPITARFGNDTTLGTTQPAVNCNQPGTSWNGPPNSLTCRRVSDTLALCRDRLGFEHEFRRE